jgi:hypothetical protein
VNGISDFLGALDGCDVPLLDRVDGRVRFDVVEGEAVDRIGMTIASGHVTIGPLDDEPDCTIRGTRATMDDLCCGEVNAMAAVLRGTVACAGDVELLFAVQRIFPGPSGHGTVTGTPSP